MTKVVGSVRINGNPRTVAPGNLDSLNKKLQAKKDKTETSAEEDKFQVYLKFVKAQIPEMNGIPSERAE